MGRPPHKTKAVRIDDEFYKKLDAMRPDFENVSIGALIERLCKEAIASRAVQAFIKEKVQG